MHALGSFARGLMLVTLSSALTLAVIIQIRPWERGDPAETPLVLSSETPVRHEWRDPAGRVVGAYATTLFEYTDVGARLSRLERDNEDISLMLYWLATDAEMRGHMMRHDMSAARLDAIAARFGPGASGAEEFLAFTEE